MVGIWGTGEEQAARHMAAHGRITYIHSCPLSCNSPPHTPCRVVEDAQHGQDAVGGAIGAADVRARGADVVDREADAAGALGDDGALLEGVVDALDAVVLHAEQEAAGELRARGAGVEQRGARVREHALRHEVVGLDRRRDVVLVDAHRDAHEHVLGALDNLAANAQQVGALQSLRVIRGRGGEVSDLPGMK